MRTILAKGCNDADPFDLGRRRLSNYQAPRWIQSYSATFWSQVSIEDSRLLGLLFLGACQRWKGGTQKGGLQNRGVFYVSTDSRQIPVRHFAYRNSIGDIPWGTSPVPCCFHVDCVNPYHLKLVARKPFSPTCPPDDALRRDQLYDAHYDEFGQVQAAKTFDITLLQLAGAAARVKEFQRAQVPPTKYWGGPLPKVVVVRPLSGRETVVDDDDDGERRWDI